MSNPDTCSFCGGPDEGLTYSEGFYYCDTCNAKIDQISRPRDLQWMRSDAYLDLAVIVMRQMADAAERSDVDTGLPALGRVMNSFADVLRPPDTPGD